MNGPFPLLVADLSFDEEPGGIRAFSYDEQNRGLDHPLDVGTAVWTRDLNEPMGSEYLAEITNTLEDGWPVHWVYFLRATDPAVLVTDLAAALHTTVEDLLGSP
ncbi:hypothetical protein [Nocardioides sp. SYSU DS0651]|uniref:hypothetical protein n=1 Tax=Nocardioides sp. SYSU DS0651 TaxID=3415955 RepID=UPI003F4B2334